MRLLRELDHLDAGRPPAAARRRERHQRVVVSVLATVVLSGATLFLAQKHFGITLTPDGFDKAAPLGSPPEVRQGLGSFAYMATQPDDPTRPVTYDPCRPIEVEVNDTLAPAGADGLVAEALAGISAATGLVFEVVGSTDRLPRDDGGFGRARREPVLVAWADPSAVPALSGDVAGVGGSTPRLHTYTGDHEYVTGMVALDAPQLSSLLDYPEGHAAVRAVVLHELAHLVGLGHVDDHAELMHPRSSRMLDLGPGDREGLAALGSGRCYF